MSVSAILPLDHLLLRITAAGDDVIWRICVQDDGGLAGKPIASGITEKTSLAAQLHGLAHAVERL